MNFREKRLLRLREELAAAGLEGFLVTRPENVFYLSGFTGSAGFLLVTPEQAFLFTDGRYTEQAQQEAPGWEVLVSQDLFPKNLPAVCRARGLGFLAFEKDHLTYHQYEVLREALPGVALAPTSGLVEKLRLVKDEEEIALIREAAQVTAAAFSSFLEHARCGQTEQEAAAAAEFFIRRQPSCSLAFETIVAAGERSALPHGVASSRVLGRGDLVVVDLGARFKRYAADLTRTVCFGSPSADQRRVYEAVAAAHARALEAVRPGVTAGEVDARARTCLEEAGYGSYFTHALGHGVGISVHEDPRLAPGQETVLEPGMVVTVEPGVYLPGWGGVRIEDTVLITPDGCEVLTPVPRALFVL